MLYHLEVVWYTQIKVVVALFFLQMECEWTRREGESMSFCDYAFLHTVIHGPRSSCRVFLPKRTFISMQLIFQMLYMLATAIHTVASNPIHFKALPRKSRRASNENIS